MSTRQIQVIQSIGEGLKVVVRNPIILAPIIINAVLICAYNYFYFHAPKLACVPEAEMPFPAPPEHFWLFSILVTLVSVFLCSIICKMVYDAVKSNVSLSEAINLSARKFIFILIASILWCLIVGIGLVALIIPGIFLSIKFIFITYAILLDDEKIINSFRKSWQITKGNWWRAFGLFLIFIIPIVILSAIAMEVATIGAVQAALVIDFVAMLLVSWLVSAFTIAYIQLTNNPEQENKKLPFSSRYRQLRYGQLLIA